MQHDVLDQVDFHLTPPATLNPRLTDLGTNPQQFRQNRLQYADSTQQAQDNAKKSSTDPTNMADPSQPTLPSRSESVACGEKLIKRATYREIA